MNSTDVYRGLDAGMTLREPSGAPLCVRLRHLSISGDDSLVTDCTATFRLDPEQYRHVDNLALFDLDPERREPTYRPEPFDLGSAVDIEASLSSDLLAHLPAGHASARVVANFLLGLSPDSPELATVNWQAVSVSQEVNGRRNGYRMAHGGTSLQQMLAQAQALVGEVEVDAAEAIKRVEQSVPVFASVYQFLLAEGWDNVLVDDEDEQPKLRMRYRGQHGEWDCLAVVREETAQFVFYSLCPVHVLEAKRQAMVEFVTRANHDMVIGNFEFHCDGDRVRFKTSIDVEGTKATQALIRPVIHTNVLMMDQYLPGIMAVLYADKPPAEAIALVEGAPDGAPSTTLPVV